jgi:hypothetical protein
MDEVDVEETSIVLRPDRWAKAINDAMPALIPLGIIGAVFLQRSDHCARKHESAEHRLSESALFAEATSPTYHLLYHALRLAPVELACSEVQISSSASDQDKLTVVANVHVTA